MNIYGRNPQRPDPTFEPNDPSERDCAGKHNWVLAIADDRNDEALWICDRCWGSITVDYAGDVYVEETEE